MTSNQVLNSVPGPRMDVGGFRLELLESLPCGCVVAIQRMPQSGVRVVSMEAKGPHCIFPEHRANKVMRLGDFPDEDDYDEEGIRVA
jgi:hypothetical protein